MVKTEIDQAAEPSNILPEEGLYQASDSEVETKELINVPVFDKKTSHINDKYFEVGPRDSESHIGEEGAADEPLDIYKKSPGKQRKDYSSAAE